MKRQSFAVRYRPKTFNDIVEQDAIKAILMEQIKTNTFKQGYLFTGPSGCGKAQPMDSKILTPKGYIRMWEVTEGAKVVDGVGKVTTIVGVYPQGVRDIYRITFNDNSFIDVSDEHINRVFRYNEDKKANEFYDITTIELIELFNKTRFNLRVPLPVLDCWETVGQTIDPYLLGILIADGSLSNNFAISNGEPDLISKVEDKLLKYNYTLKKINDNDYAMVRGEGPQPNQHTLPRTLPRRIADYGLDTQSYNKHIPKCYLYASIEDRLEILRGLFDGDGSICKNGQYEYTTSSPQLSEDFSFLVRSLGIVDTISEYPSGYYKDNEYIECRTSYCHRLKVPNDLIIVSSKKHLNRRTLKQNKPIRKIVSIDFIGKQECQCIKVESSDETYITDNVTITHNTTAARIFANDINEGKGNPIELDAASNNSVEDIRQIISNAKRKSLDSEYKVYILDEVHMLSTGAWNALLKLLEEPPAGVVFIMCTTDPQKIPPTILSRVQRYDFSRISLDSIIDRLKYILEEENLNIIDENGGTQDSVVDIEWAIKEGIPVIIYQEEAIQYIAKMANGGMRDAITMMDKCLSLENNLTMENVVKSLGTVDYNIHFELLYQLAVLNPQRSVEIIEQVYNSGKDIKQFMKQFQFFILDVCKYKLFGTFKYINIPELEEYKIKMGDEDYNNCLRILEWVRQLNADIKWESNAKAVIQSSALLYCKLNRGE